MYLSNKEHKDAHWTQRKVGELSKNFKKNRKYKRINKS